MLLIKVAHGRIFKECGLRLVKGVRRAPRTLLNHWAQGVSKRRLFWGISSASRSTSIGGTEGKRRTSRIHNTDASILAGRVRASNLYVSTPRWLLTPESQISQARPLCLCNLLPKIGCRKRSRIFVEHNWNQQRLSPGTMTLS